MGIVTNGEVELARGVAPLLNVDSSHVVGTGTKYDNNGSATGRMISYEIHDSNWGALPQPGKVLALNGWAKANHPGEKLLIAGFDGDSASPDGGAMLFMQPKLMGSMVDTPGAHDQQRINRFMALVNEHGGRYECNLVVLRDDEPKDGLIPR